MGKAKKGQTRRASVMDRFNLPDLTEFMSTLAVLTRGCETGSFDSVKMLLTYTDARRDKGYPPTTLNDGTVLIMPPREKKALFDRSVFQPMIEMDYNTDAMVEIIHHSCWEDLQRSKFVLEILLSEIGHGWVSEKLPVYETVLERTLRLEDSLQVCGY